MALIGLSYVPMLFDGAAGIEIRATDPDPLRLRAKFGPEAMARRISKLMRATKGMLQLYTKFQFESSGLGYSRIAGQLGLVGGSVAEWAPLEQSTLLHRERGYNYYGAFGGSGVDPRSWSGNQATLAQQNIVASSNSVDVSVSDKVFSILEETRPVFVLEEVTNLVKSLAQKVFQPISGKGEALVFAEGAFGIRVGESQPFQDSPGKGRPRSVTPQARLLRRIARGLDL